VDRRPAGDGPAARLLGAADVRRIAARLGIRPAKRLGQNFVIDQGTIRRIVALADLRPADIVLEVGPGLGSLTLGLIEAAGRVVAVEIDPVLAAELPATVAARAGSLAARLDVVGRDALDLAGPGDLPGDPPSALVANLPYNVAVPVLLHLLDVLPSVAKALVMVQAEVADRMCAPPGSRTYGVPSVKLAWYGSARRAGPVSRSVFWPAPNVDSALVAFTRWPGGHEPGQALGRAPGQEPGRAPGREPGQPPGREPARAPGRAPGQEPGQPPGLGRAEVFAVIDAAFAQRRKTLRSALAGWAGSARAAERLLRAAGVDPALRGEAIGIEQYCRIAEAAEREQRGAGRSIIESWRK